MAKLQTPRSAWVDAALAPLAAGGPEAVRIEALAKDLGVTKGGFYWHFKDRAALLDEVLDTWERAAVAEAIDAVESDGGDARAKLDHLFKLASSSTGPLPRAELAIRDWARRDKAVAARLRRVDNRRMDYLRHLFRGICRDEDDVEARCLLAFSLFIGAPFVTANHPGHSRAEAIELALASLLR